MKLVVSLVAALVTTTTFAATPASKGDPKAAESIVNQLCVACHGVDGNSPTPANPNIAGLNAEYINKQLTEFKSGTRQNAIMAGMVAGLSPQDMLNLGAYFSAQQAKPGTAADKELALVGQKIYRGGVQGTGVPACASCHGVQGKGIPAQFPRLAGQHSEYIYTQLNAFRLGARSNDAAKMMQSIAVKMTDADMKAVAAYVQGLQ